MELLVKIWSVIEKNRWTTIIPIVGIILWIMLSFSCVPKTDSPIRTNSKVNAVQLSQDYERWKAEIKLTAKRFEDAAADIERQQEQWGTITNLLMKVASGGVTDYQGLLNIVLGSGLLGIGADNVRKNGVIAGLKRGKKRKK